MAKAARAGNARSWIAALEDKIVQQAVGTILHAIYEVDFRGVSYGFRPGSSPRQALDADIRGVSHQTSHAWAMQFI